MNKELELLRFLKSRLEMNQGVVLIVVVQSSGSSPGRQGFKMVVAEDGTLFGSIGGGVMEVRLVEDSKLKLQESKFKVEDSRLIEQVHRNDAPNSSGMICSGRQTVIVKVLGIEDLETIREITVCLQNGGDKFIELTEKVFRTVDSKDFQQNYSFRKVSDDSFVYREKIGFKNQLYIIGGGHCALALSELMSGLDFAVRVFDDRPNLNTLSKNVFADSIEVIDAYDTIGERFDPNENTFENAYVVIMTLGYKFDEIVIRQLAGRDFKYLGVLGSKAKMNTMLAGLIKDGIDEEWLRKLRTPIGLPINSRTPREIAVSIAAEIIAVKNDASEA